MAAVPAREYMPFAVVWTRDDCEKLEAAGFLNYRYELIEGVILKKVGQFLRHATVITKAMAWLLGRFDSGEILTQISIYVAEADNTVNKPEPDVLLLNKRAEDIATDQLRPEDIRLLIEVSDTTLAYDLGTKAGLYARAGIPEYWVISIAERTLYVHSAPREGTYQRTAVAENATVAPLFAPHATLTIADLLPAPGASA
jgi:Uma2 family endonuclease